MNIKYNSQNEFDRAIIAKKHTEDMNRFYSHEISKCVSQSEIFSL